MSLPGPINFNSQMTEIVADQNYDAGDIIRISDMHCVALQDVLEGQTVPVAFSGVFDFPKDDQPCAVGDVVYRLTAKQVSCDIGSHSIGVCVQRAAGPDPTVRMWFIGFIGN